MKDELKTSVASSRTKMATACSRHVPVISKDSVVGPVGEDTTFG